MNRDEKRRFHQWCKNATSKQFWVRMNELNSGAYGLCQKHYHEAMEIELQPKQRKAVIQKAEQIREQWDGIHAVTVDDTEGINFKTATEAIQGLSTGEAAIYNLTEQTMVWIGGRAFVVRQATEQEIKEAK